jgi:HK97 family phage major capsid protein
VSNKAKRASLIEQANALVNKPGQYTKEDDAKVRSLITLADALNFDTETITEEQRKTEHREAFRHFLKTGENRTYTPMSDAVQGAFIVPDQFYNTLLTGIAQYSELMDVANVNLITSEKGGTMKLPQIDLSSISSSIVAENTDTPPVANPVVSSLSLKGFTYRTNPIAATLVLEQDSFESVMDILGQAFAVGLARGIGSDLVTGAGSGSAPQGILTAAADSTVTSAGSAFTKAELQSIYFSVNRAYRISPKAAWLMHDDTYNSILALKDATTNRPLVNITEDGEKLFGKRILISPEMPTAAGSKAVLFGDLGQYQVRVIRNGATIRRNFQAPGYAEKAVALYTGFLRVDAALNAPNGAKPVVYGTLHA